VNHLYGCKDSWFRELFAHLSLCGTSDRRNESDEMADRQHFLFFHCYAIAVLFNPKKEAISFIATNY
jgi:hypothetical protein